MLVIPEGTVNDWSAPVYKNDATFEVATDDWRTKVDDAIPPGAVDDDKSVAYMRASGYPAVAFENESEVVPPVGALLEDCNVTVPFERVTPLSALLLTDNPPK
jgi:hypothetical protein